jgi:hypothetical protein
MVGDRVAGGAQLLSEKCRSVLLVVRELGRRVDALIDLHEVSELVIRSLIQRAILAKHGYRDKNEQTE